MFGCGAPILSLRPRVGMTSTDFPSPEPSFSPFCGFSQFRAPFFAQTRMPGQEGWGPHQGLQEEVNAQRGMEGPSAHPLW